MYPPKKTIIGTTLNDRYRIDDQAGGGAMATVYRATDLRTQAIVAVKHLKDTAIQADTAQITRFERESQAMHNLSHPNIVNVLDTLSVDDDHFIVMDYVAGGTLKDLIASSGKLDIAYALKIARDIASAMVLVHDADIIHRDIKPDNILVTKDGVARLTDFGMARFTYLSRLTRKNMTVGSMMYMAPEQFKTGEAVVQSDIWAYGVTMYETLTGQHPFASLPDIVRTDPTPVTTLRPEAPLALDSLMQKIFEKNYRQRITSFEDVLDQLNNIKGTSS